MYERFTDRARKVMQLANQEAQRFNHEYIGTEHILLGLIAEGSGVAANVLKNLNIDLEQVRVEVVKIVQRGAASPHEVMGRLPHTPRTKKVIEYAIEEARSFKHNYVGTEHLLLGLLLEQEGVGAQVLLHLGLTLDGIRSEVLKLLGHEVPGRLARTPRDAPPLPELKVGLLTPEQRVMFEELRRQFTEKVQDALAGQDYETAMRYNQALLDLHRIMLRLDGPT